MGMRFPEKKEKEKEKSGPNLDSEVTQCHEKKKTKEGSVPNVNREGDRVA